MKKEVQMETLRIFLPEKCIENFEVEKVEEKTNWWEVKLVEKAEKIPLSLRGKKYSYNGYCNPLELQGFPVKGKPLYL